MSARLAQQLKQAFSKCTTSRELSIHIINLLKYIQNSSIDDKNRESIAFSLLRGFSLNDNYLNQLICVSVTQLLPFENSFIAINILKKEDPLSRRLLLKILPEEMLSDFKTMIYRGVPMNIINLTRSMVLDECVRLFKQHNNVLETIYPYEKSKTRDAKGKTSEEKFDSKMKSEIPQYNKFEGDPDVLAIKEMSQEAVLAHLVKTGKFESFLKNASEGLSGRIRMIKDEFSAVNSDNKHKMLGQYHQMIVDHLEEPFSNYHGYKNIKNIENEEENEFDFSLTGNLITNESNSAIMKRGIVGVHQIRLENNIKDYLNVKNAGEMCFSEAVRRLNMCEGDISFAASQIQMIFQNTRGFSYEDKSNEVLIFSLLRSLDLLSQKHPSKLTILNPSFLKLNNNIAMNILLRTGDKTTIQRILNKEFDIFTDNERGIEILRTFFKIVMRENQIEKMVEFLTPLLLRRTSMEMKKEVVTLFGEILKKNTIRKIKHVQTRSKHPQTNNNIGTGPSQKNIFTKKGQVNEKGGQRDTTKTVSTRGGSNKKSETVDIKEKSVHNENPLRPEKDAFKVKLEYSDTLEETDLSNRIREKIFKSLTDYMEDCPHPVILRDIFGLIDDQKYKINVYNRLLLEQENVRNSALLSLDRMKMQYDDELEESDDDELMRFYLQNRSRSPESAIRKFVSNHIEITESRPNFIKTSRPKIILDKELKIIAHKKTYMDYFYVVFTLINTTKELEIKDCKLQIQVSGDSKELPFENILKEGNIDILETNKSNFELSCDSITSLQTKTMVVKRKRTHSNEIFSVHCDFELKDTITGESESEHRSCKEFDVNLIDFVRDCDQEFPEIRKNQNYEKSLSFAIENKTLMAAKDYILDVIDMRICDQKQSGDTLTFYLTGEHIDHTQDITPIGFEVKLEYYGGDIAAFMRIIGNKECVDQIADILQ